MFLRQPIIANDYFTIITIIGPTINRSDASPKYNEEYISFLKYSYCNGKPQKAQLPAFHILLIQLDQILSILVTIWVNYFPPAGLPLGPPPHAHQQSDSKGADLKMAARLSETSTHLHIPRIQAEWSLQCTPWQLEFRQNDNYNAQNYLQKAAHHNLLIGLS